MDIFRIGPVALQMTLHRAFVVVDLYVDAVLGLGADALVAGHFAVAPIFLVSIDTSTAWYAGRPGMSNLIFFRRHGSQAKVGRRRRLDVTEGSFAIGITEAKLL